MALAATAADRARTYHQLLHDALPDDDLAAIRAYLQQQRALGRNDFRTMVEAKARRFAGVRSAHRPSRGADEAKK